MCRLESSKAIDNSGTDDVPPVTAHTSGFHPIVYLSPTGAVQSLADVLNKSIDFCSFIFSMAWQPATMDLSHLHHLQHLRSPVHTGQPATWPAASSATLSSPWSFLFPTQIFLTLLQHPWNSVAGGMVIARTNHSGWSAQTRVRWQKLCQ